MLNNLPDSHLSDIRDIFFFLWLSGFIAPPGHIAILFLVLALYPVSPAPSYAYNIIAVSL